MGGEKDVKNSKKYENPDGTMLIRYISLVVTVLDHLPGRFHQKYGRGRNMEDPTVPYSSEVFF